jgi:hypothetical protein
MGEVGSWAKALGQIKIRAIKKGAKRRFCQQEVRGIGLQFLFSLAFLGPLVGV